MQYLSTADLSTLYLSFYSFVSANCLSPTCQPMSTDYHRPVYRLPVFLYLCTCQLPTCPPPNCPPMLIDYPTTADLSTVYLSSYSFASANYLLPTCLPMSTDLPVFLFLCICQLPTCPPVHLSNNQYAVFVYCQPVYCLPSFLLLCICQLPTCLPPICQPMSTDYHRPVYRLPFFLFLCICKLPTYLPPTCQPMFIDYHRPVYLYAQ